jgi:hypothetical protein
VTREPRRFRHPAPDPPGTTVSPESDNGPFELGNVTGASSNAGLIAIMANRLRELDPGWPGTAAPRAAGSVPDENTDDDPE